MKPVRSLIAGLALSAVASASWASSDFLDKDSLNALTGELGAVLSYKGVTPAEPLGLIGIDIGVEVTGTQLSKMNQWAGAVGGSDVAFLPLPKVHVHKGLPMGIDIGAVYSKVPTTDMAYAGGELRYSFVSGNVAIPAVAVRGAYTTILGIKDLSFTTKSVEVLVSKGFLMLTPYAGVGQVWANSSVDAGLIDPALSGITSLEGSATLSKWFVGLNLNLGLVNFVYETDTTGESLSHTIKMGFRF